MKCAAVALLLAAGCASHQPAISKVLIIDGAAVPAESPPLDLQPMAYQSGCAQVAVDAPWEAVLITIESVVSPTELVVRGRYGVERVRPRLSGATVGRLRQLSGREREVVARLSASLVGKEFIEPAADYSPAASIDGRRLVRLLSPDLQPLTKTMDDILDEMLEEFSSESDSDAMHADTGLHAPLEFARVPLDAPSLTTRVARAVEAVERYSDIHLPADLLVTRVSFGGRPNLSPSQRDAWRQLGECLGNPESGEFQLDPSRLGTALPGGTIFLNSSEEWCELDMHYALLHELVHQHQYALCESGVLLGGLPIILVEAHASSLALSILKQSGASDEAVDFVRAWDSYLAGVQAFDALRESLGLTPDECLLHLVDNPEQATWLSRRIEFGQFCCAPPDTAADEGPLTFEIVGSFPGGRVVAIVNESEQPFAGYLSGSWHSVTVASKTWFGGGTPPFALRLPPRGRLLVKTNVGMMAEEAIDSCHAAYRQTLAPVFEPDAQAPPVSDGSSG